MGFHMVSHRLRPQLSFSLIYDLRLHVDASVHYFFVSFKATTPLIGTIGYRELGSLKKTVRGGSFVT